MGRRQYGKALDGFKTLHHKNDAELIKELMPKIPFNYLRGLTKSWEAKHNKPIFVRYKGYQFQSWRNDIREELDKRINSIIEYYIHRFAKRKKSWLYQHDYDELSNFSVKEDYSYIASEGYKLLCFESTFKEFIWDKFIFDFSFIKDNEDYHPEFKHITIELC